MDRRRLLGALAAAPAALALGATTKEPKRKDPPQPRASSIACANSPALITTIKDWTPSN